MRNWNRREVLKSLAAIGAFGPLRDLPFAAPGYPDAGSLAPFTTRELLARVNHDSALINLHTGDAVIPRLQVLHNGSLVHEVADAAGTLNLPLQNLRRGKNSYQVRYKWRGAWLELPKRTFVSQREPGEPFTVAFLADAHMFDYDFYEGNIEGLRGAQSLIAADRPDILFFLGDEIWAQYKWKYRGLSFSDPREASIFLWEEFRLHYADLLANQMNCFVIGNHDNHSGYRILSKTISAGIDIKKAYFPCPTHNTYPEGGENNKFNFHESGDRLFFSPVENYYAFTWGDALFVVLDVETYTNLRQKPPRTPQDWTLGETQYAWLEQTLAQSSAPWKFLMSHHLVGGWDKDPDGYDGTVAYGRGGGMRYANVGEQRKIHKLMVEHDVTAFLYGHDHMFVRQVVDGISYICCGKPNVMDPRWWETPAWQYAYPEFYGVPGYLRLHVHKDQFVRFEYVRSWRDPSETHKAGSPGTPIATFKISRRDIRS